jgi:hypothetical protein
MPNILHFYCDFSTYFFGHTIFWNVFHFIFFLWNLHLTLFLNYHGFHMVFEMVLLFFLPLNHSTQFCLKNEWRKTKQSMSKTSIQMNHKLHPIHSAKYTKWLKNILKKPCIQKTNKQTNTQFLEAKNKIKWRNEKKLEKRNQNQH